MEYVILAAGQGSRFTKEGERNCKPMVEILGQPMIGRLINILSQCDAEVIHIATNEDFTALNQYLAELSKTSPVRINFRPIHSDNSFYSLTEACRDAKGRFIAMTVDAIFPTAEFKEYVARVATSPEDEVLMGLTEFVDDESPLYAKLSADGSEVVNYRYGGEPFHGKTIVSAGMYGLTSKSIEYAQKDGYPESLSDFQRILAVTDGYKVRPYVFSKAFDVDCGHDRIEAEKFVAEVNGEKRAE